MAGLNNGESFQSWAGLQEGSAPIEKMLKPYLNPTLWAKALRHLGEAQGNLPPKFQRKHQYLLKYTHQGFISPSF